ncbi:hypothetical protein LQV05_005965 [Cryptococcus neoformans]|nr:hypothetical protein C356_05187 [Cryptococcus neoformans var. grubii c45]OXB35183.1 hypothetical protein J007_05121 [Cryptococcus neoformans var. grubii]OXC59313.1 hypothetical protein C358_05239 [Cryptococcus neoformans var. grubii MW-RSA852]UOH83246.1 hypothetical protein LQV05_005965 [Cryptococcus neoformans]
MSRPSIILHATPPLRPLPASDAESLYYAALLQLAAPDSWALTRGDWGDNGGKLPFITHLAHPVPPAHLSSLPSFSDPDEELEDGEKLDAACWKAYIEGNAVDIVNHTYYSLPPNYPSTVAKSQFTGLPFPMNQYIPQRIRSIIKSRLEFVGLWGLGGLNVGDAEDEDRKRQEEQFIVGPGGTTTPRAWTGWRSGQEMDKRRRKWGEHQLEQKIKAIFDPLARRLGKKAYFFGEQPTTVDLAFFAQLAFVLAPTLPNPLLPNVLRSLYPSLVAHHDRLLERLFPSWSTVPMVMSQTPARITWGETFASWLPGPSRSRNQPSSSSSTDSKDNSKGQNGCPSKPKTDKQKAFERGRWLWFAGAAVSMVAYLFVSGVIALEFGDEEEDEDWVAYEEEGEGEGEETTVLEYEDEEQR